MNAAAKHENGSTRISSLVVATVASGTVAGLVVLGTVTGVLPSRSPARVDEPPRIEPQTARAATCPLCGTIESVKTIELYEEPTASNESIDARSADTAGGGPGGAIAGGATSVIDTLTGVVRGSDADKNIRKRVVYRVTLRMDDGSFRAISLPSPPAFAVGDKVKVVEGRLVSA
jgi:outer membrane lipoprotein SlyB